MNYMRTGLSARFKGVSEGYGDSRFFWKPSFGPRLFFEKIAGTAYHTRGFDRNKDSRVEKAGLVWSVGSDGERIGGPDHTMGGQGAKRTNDRDIDADTSEASAGTGNRYGKDPRKRKRTGVTGWFVGGRMGEQPGVRLEA